MEASSATAATTTVANLTADATAMLETKVVQMLDALQNGATEIGDQVVKYTPDMIQAALGVTIISGIQELIYGLIWFIVFIYVFRYWKTHKWTNKEAEQTKLVFSGIGSVICFIGTIDQLCDIWNWTAVFYPKLYIAHQIIEKALSTTQGHH